MSDSFFPSPSGEQNADDPFETPNDELAHGELGGPASPGSVAAARSPKQRKAVFMITAAVLSILFVLFIATRKGSSAPKAKTDQAVQAAQKGARKGEGIDTANNSLDPIRTAEPDKSRPAQPGSEVVVDPNAATNATTGGGAADGRGVTAMLDPNNPGAVTQPGITPPVGGYGAGQYGAQPGQPTQPVPGIPGVASQPSIPMQPLPGQPGQPYPGAGMPAAGQPAHADSASQADREAEAQRRLDAQREAEAQAAARREALLAARKAEEDRLRKSATLVVENKEGTQAAGGASRFGGASAGPGTGGAGAQTPGRNGLAADYFRRTGKTMAGFDENGYRVGGEAGPGGAPAAAGASSGAGSQYGIIPGTQVRAILTSEFISDAQGGGDVEARLTAPLAVKGRVILPAGTRVFGRASASGGTPSKPARVAIQFTTWVTPQGQVVRDISGNAADPNTLAKSIAGKVDNRYASRIARGVASTALDIALTAKTQDRASVFEQPSPRDQAITDARKRLDAMINPTIGDEGSERPAIRLSRDTEFTIIFGL